MYYPSTPKCQGLRSETSGPNPFPFLPLLPSLPSSFGECSFLIFSSLSHSFTKLHYPAFQTFTVHFILKSQTYSISSLSQILRGIQEGDLISPDLSLLFIQRLFGLGWKLFLLQCLHLCTSLAVVYALMLFLFLP